MHQRFDRVHHELTENRERMAKLEGSLDGSWPGAATATPREREQRSPPFTGSAKTPSTEPAER